MIGEKTLEDCGIIKRKGEWLQTYSGGRVYPLDPRPEEIDILDIAAALSKLCRYGGHCLQFYSVAEHCVLMTRYARKYGFRDQVLLQLLLHDASEAYLVDIPRPLKKSLPDYQAAERGMEYAISQRFGLEIPNDPIVHKFDEAIGLAEREQNLAVPQFTWELDFEASRSLPVTLQFWEPRTALNEFLSEFFRCGGQRLEAGQ